MIARYWSARAPSRDAAAEYREHFRAHVVPALRRLEGYLGAALAEGPHGVAVDGTEAREVVVVTRWRSLDAIRAFAGDDVEHAVVADEAARCFTEHDRRARHYEIAATDPGEPAALDPRLRPYEPMWTMDVARYALVESEGGGHWLMFDLDSNGVMVIDDEPAITGEVRRRMLAAGVRRMRDEDSWARVQARGASARALRAQAERIATRSDLVAWVRAVAGARGAADNAPRRLTLEEFLGGVGAAALAAGDGDERAHLSWRAVAELLLDGIEYWDPSSDTRRRERR